MFTLAKFEKQINDTVLKRGKNYYEQGMVVELEETGDCFWQAEVEGTESYTVEITLGKNNAISDYSCTCPYDGGICKHVVAVLFTIKDEIKIAPSDKTKANKKAVFDDLLKKIGLNELQTFIAVYALKNKDFKTAFELHFAEKDERVDVSKSMKI